jgi:hypothetical protein
MICDDRELPLDEFESAMLAELLAAQTEFGPADKGVGRKLYLAGGHGGLRHHRLLAAAAVLVAAVAVLAVLLPSGGGDSRRGQPSAVAPHHKPTTHAVAPHHPRTIHYQVTGYTQAQATAAATQCLSADGAGGPDGAAGKDAVLRATFSDPSGSTLVVTTPSGWYTCDESADGSTLVPGVYESYIQAEGGALNANDLYEHWLMEPVEIFSDGGGYLSKATMASGWLDTAVGRAAPNITKVTVQMPGGSVIAASVENGFFVARQLLPSMPAFSQSGTIPVMGYDSSGTLVYDSLLTRLPLTACFVTPSGQPLTPSATSSQGCQTAIAWGY